MKQSSTERNLWCLTVLCLLRERPMHPYEMQQVISRRHKDDFLELKRGSLYHAIRRLGEAGLIEEHSTGREGRRPERTVYRLTDAGEAELVVWLRRLMAEPTREASPFVAAMSFVCLLSPQETVEQLEIRVAKLDSMIAGSTAVVSDLVRRLGRLPLVEAEYAIAMQKAEREWVRSVIDDIRTGRLTWDPEQVLQWARGMTECNAAQKENLQ